MNDMDAATAPLSPVAAHTWDGQGYRPLVFSGDWQVALLNWEPLFDPDNLGEIERHNDTDEVFVLWRGQSALFIATDQGIELLDMELGRIYNVARSTWHNLVGSRDASWIIVETRDTHLHDTQVRPMTGGEVAQVRSQLPAWLRE